MSGSGARHGVGFAVETTSFVDRRDELAAAKRLLSAGRLLTLTGTGGVGKTRLAGRVAGRVSRAFPDGVWLVSLATLRDGALVPHAVADVLGVHDDAGGQMLDVIVEHLRGRRLLLVLDDCEHLLDACVRLVDAILPRAAGVRVLATSRHRLNVSGEHLLEVLPLGVPASGVQARDVAAAKAFPALELFADRVTAVVPGFKMTAGNLEQVARVCRRLDGLPLAIELAAVRMRSHSLEQLAARLDDRYRLLTGPAVLSRHQTLRAAIDWSYELCTPAEQRVWALLSVFGGSFDLGAVEAVCAGQGIDAADVLGIVAELVDKSILVSERHVDAPRYRYRLLTSLRDYGLEKLSELGEVSATRRRHRDHYLRLAEECERQWFGPRQLEIVDELRAELDNFRTALDFCVTTAGEVQQGLRMVAILWCYWTPGGAHDEMRHWFHRAVHHGAKPSGGWANTFWVCGMVILLHTRSTEVLHAGGPPARAREELPVAASMVGHVSGWQHAEGGLLGFVVLGRIELACTLVFQATPDQAVPLCVEAIAMCEARGEQWARSYALRTLAMAEWVMGEYDSATAHARECLRLTYVVHDRQSLGRTLDLLATIAAGTGDAERAAVLQGAAERIWHEVGRSPLTSLHRRAGRIRASERQARSALGDRGFERVFKRGGELSRDDVVVYALQDRSRVPERLKKPKTTSVESPDTRLTPRERQVAELIAQGLTDKQIAAALVISQRTVEGHVQRMLAKLGFPNRVRLAAWVSSAQPQGERPESR